MIPVKQTARDTFGCILKYFMTELFDWSVSLTTAGILIDVSATFYVVFFISE
jgi:hypothetical protein